MSPSVEGSHAVIRQTTLQSPGMASFVYVTYVTLYRASFSIAPV